MMVPAGTEGFLPQWAHSQGHALGPSLALAAVGETNPCGQRAANTITDAGRLIREAALQLGQRAGKVGRGGGASRRAYVRCLTRGPRYNISYPRTLRDKPSPKIDKI